MAYTGEFPGKILINGELVADNLSIYLTEETLILSKAGARSPKKEIYLSPFNKFMVFTQTPAKLKEPFFYEVTGTSVGSIAVGPIGHPGDGEYDIRPMKSFRLDVRYLSDQIEVAISGKTSVGTDGFDANKTLEPWDFSAQFSIAKSQIPEFFKLTDFVRDNVLKLFDDVFGSAL